MCFGWLHFLELRKNAIGIGVPLAGKPLPDHRTYGSRIRRFGCSGRFCYPSKTRPSVRVKYRGVNAQGRANASKFNPNTVMRRGDFSVPLCLERLVLRSKRSAKKEAGGADSCSREAMRAGGQDAFALSPGGKRVDG